MHISMRVQLHNSGNQEPDGKGATTKMTAASRVSGWSLQIAAQLVLVIAAGLVGWFLLDSDRAAWEIVLAGVSAHALLFFSGWLNGIGRRMKYARTFSIADVPWDEFFVLYLRRFISDRSSKSGVVDWDPMSPVPAFGAVFGISGEERMIHALEPIGRVVTLARPGERVPPLGALRIELEGDDWKPFVEELMLRARLVVVDFDDSDALRWELEIARKSLAPNRLIVMVHGRTGFEKLQSHFSGLVPRCRFEGLRTPVVISFSDDWTPHLLYPTDQCRKEAIWITLLQPVYPRFKAGCSRSHHG